MFLLAEWLKVMRQWHPSYFAPVADCWASHPEVVIELNNVTMPSGNPPKDVARGRTDVPGACE